MVWKVGTRSSSRVKIKKVRWASPMVKLVEVALHLVYPLFAILKSSFSDPPGHFVRE
jgi:hypothetical protein